MSVLLLQHKHMLGCCDLSSHIAALHLRSLPSSIRWWLDSILSNHAIRHTALTIVEVLHAFVDVVFLAHFRSEIVSHLIAPVCAQSLVILLRRQVLGHGASFFTRSKKQSTKIRKDDSMNSVKLYLHW